MFRSFTLALAFTLASPPVASSAAQVPMVKSAHANEETRITVTITGLRNSKGQILVQLWNRPDGFPVKGEDGLTLTVVDASKSVEGTVTTTFQVVPGTYAVSILHDENSNNKMDTNALGIPKEGYGASNNPITHFHAPSFDQAKFQVPASGFKTSIAVRY